MNPDGSSSSPGSAGNFLQRLLREPLLHFFVLGVALFALYGWLNRSGFGRPDEIVVSQGQLKNLGDQFQRVWQRPPSTQEMQLLVDNWVREEIFYREGLAMGLDRDDPVVRRRIQQKVEFIVENATPDVPTTEELQRWLDDHPDAYMIEANYSLRQIYFDPARRASHLQTDMAAAQRALISGSSVKGDATMLPATLQGPASDVSRTFGDDFEVTLRDLPIGSWQGPVRSGFGMHLVKLISRVPMRIARLDEVRPAVERDLLHARVQQATDAFYQRLRANYNVRVEDAVPAPAGPPG